MAASSVAFMELKNNSVIRQLAQSDARSIVCYHGLVRKTLT